MKERLRANLQKSQTIHDNINDEKKNEIDKHTMDRHNSICIIEQLNYKIYTLLNCTL